MKKLPQTKRKNNTMNATTWRYGDSWEKYPIEEGETWTEQRSGSKLQVFDLYDGLPEFVKDADLVYVDPPWSSSALNGFYGKAGLETRRNFEELVDVFFSRNNDFQ